MNVPIEVIRAAEIMSQETHLQFRDCLDILMRSYLAQKHQIEHVSQQLVLR